MVQITGVKASDAVDRLTLAAVMTALCMSKRFEWRFESRVMEGVATQFTRRKCDKLRAERGEARLQECISRKNTGHLCTYPFNIGETLAQIEHATALGEDRFSGSVVLLNFLFHRDITRQCFQMEFRVTSGQPEGIHIGESVITKR